MVTAPGVELRSRRAFRRATATGRGGPVTPDAIAFTEPVRVVSRGQVAVFHDGDRVLGGARIC